ncbi:uncharacterized protein LOC135154288 isoform X2 [Lytechinus pictus]|uniref:uncharacterized protein LOC135154288 isoform X2 n=1 Tax=Lytechinus pictus TaxID=7653 RepID=UPI0030BA05AD
MSSFSPVNESPAESVQLPAEYLVDGDEWMKFNVGGTMLETMRANIDKLRSSFFAQLLDRGIGDDHAPIDVIYRIDRDPQALQVFFNYGRYGKIVSVPEHISESFLLHEHKFYGMQNTIANAVRTYFVERSKGPMSIQLERVTITELAMDKKYLHHNVYGIIRGTQLCCFTNVLGKGVCYKDVGRFFIYEKPHEKQTALFRTNCWRCKHIVCLADDALIGLEGWCHKCSLCLRCQDILCESSSKRDNVDDPDSYPNGNAIVRKTASAVFVSNTSPNVLTLEPSYKEAVSDEDDDKEVDLRVMITDPLADMALKNKQKGVSGMSSKKFSLIPPEDEGSKLIEPQNNRLKLPKIHASKAVPAGSGISIAKGMRYMRRNTEPAALNIDQFANFLDRGEW